MLVVGIIVQISYKFRSKEEGSVDEVEIHMLCSQAGNWNKKTREIAYG